MIGPLAYIGGKRRIAPQIVSLVPAHDIYVEPFAGGAQVFFHKEPSRSEVLNDLDREVVNFFRILQRHSVELIRTLECQPASRAIFDWHHEQRPELLTDVERAARFFYLQKNSWSGKRIGQNFHRCVSKPSNYNPLSVEQRLSDAARRLARVQLECAPYQDILRHYDRPQTFFYIDPPYVDVALYQHNFTDEQFEELASLLRNLRGRFLLSINDCDKARAWFVQYFSQPIEFTYTSTRNPKRFRELLFANYPLPPVDAVSPGTTPAA